MSKPKIERSVNVPDDVIRELLTESEWRMVKQRLLIIHLLQEGLSIRQVAERAKVGTDTVVRMSKKMRNPDFKKTLGKLGLEQNVYKSKWVFGKSEE